MTCIKYADNTSSFVEELTNDEIMYIVHHIINDKNIKD